MKAIILEGNTVVREIDASKEPGKFVFIFCTNGTFYLDTTIGTMWKLNNLSQICTEHAEIVKHNLENL